jgi:hypothetical protein
MWWNFVARNHDEITVAYADWQAAAGGRSAGGRSGSARFGPVASALPRIPAPQPPWLGRH